MGSLFGIVVTRDGGARKTPLVNFCQPEAFFVKKRAMRFELTTFTLAKLGLCYLSLVKKKTYGNRFPRGAEIGDKPAPDSKMLT